jgi:hypothetical protein
MLAEAAGGPNLLNGVLAVSRVHHVGSSPGTAIRMPIVFR